MNLLNSSQQNYRFHAVSRRSKFAAAAAFGNHAAWRRSAAADNTVTVLKFSIFPFYMVDQLLWYSMTLIIPGSRDLGVGPYQPKCTYSYRLIKFQSLSRPGGSVI